MELLYLIWHSYSACIPINHCYKRGNSKTVHRLLKLLSSPLVVSAITQILRNFPTSKTIIHYLGRVNVIATYSTPNIWQIPTCPRVIMQHSCLLIVLWLSVFVLAVDHSFLSVILPLKESFYFIWSIGNVSWTLLRFFRHSPSCHCYGCSRAM